jgi:hypothetical protein
MCEWPTKLSPAVRDLYDEKSSLKLDFNQQRNIKKEN